MTDRAQHTPGPASGAQVRKDGEKWTLILVRELRHSPEKVWQALTDPAHLGEWALRCRWQPWYGWTGEAHHDGSARRARLLDRLDDRLDGHVPADMFKRFADVRSLYG